MLWDPRGNRYTFAMSSSGGSNAKLEKTLSLVGPVLRIAATANTHENLKPHQETTNYGIALCRDVVFFHIQHEAGSPSLAVLNRFPLILLSMFEAMDTQRSLRCMAGIVSSLFPLCLTTCVQALTSSTTDVRQCRPHHVRKIYRGRWPTTYVLSNDM